MIVFPCHVCRTDLQAEEAQVGQLVRCPSCMTTLRVPAPAGDDPAAALAAMAAASQSSTQPSAVSAPPMPPSTALAPPPPGYPQQYTAPQYPPQPYPPQQYPPPYAPPPAGMYPGGGTMMFAPPQAVGRRYGFNCGHCSSRLEANESMAAQEGTCPTCGNTITIPILDRYGRLIDPKTRQIIKQDPHPVHAYAAAGERAPEIIKQSDGSKSIRCTRCGGMSVISANNCIACGMPFTMEGTTLEAAGGSNGFAVASLVLGIIGIFSCVVVVPSLLALVFGIIGYNQASKVSSSGGGRGLAISGAILGAIGLVLALFWLTSR